MNERIRELAEQAGITTNLDTDYYEKDMNKWVDYFSEKFAELLVTECAMFVVVELEGQVGSLIADRTAKRLEEHFGIEE